jgi:hypothetical protein
MRNNGKTSMIDYGGYRSNFDLFLFPLVNFLASHDRTGFNLEGGVWNRGGGDERAAVTVVELRWRLGFGFEVKLAWRCMGEVHPTLYRGAGRVRKD